VPRFFFIIRWSDRKIEDDPHGVDLPNIAEALSYAERTIRELQIEGEYYNEEPMIIVKDETQQTVLSLPFFPACA